MAVHGLPGWRLWDGDPDAAADHRDGVGATARGHEPRIALAVRTRLADGRSLTVVNVHFDWVRDDTFRFAQGEALTRYLDGLKTPYVLLGDFNDLPESRTFGLCRARAGEARKPDSDRFTFPATEPAREIDFIFFAPASEWSARDVTVIDDRTASDHRPVVAVLSPRPAIRQL